MTTMTTSKARWLRRLAYVPRWTVMPTLQSQSVAEHTFHVIVLCRWLVSQHAEKDTGNFELDVLRLALEHDADEAKSGDIPTPHKHGTPDEQQARLTDENVQGLSHLEMSQAEVVVKCADKLEAILFVHQEMLMGNNYGTRQLLDDVETRFSMIWDKFEQEGKIKTPWYVVIEAAKSISYSNHSPHPAMESGNYGD